VDKWAAENETTRSDAIRELIEAGLLAKTLDVSKPVSAAAESARALKPKKAAKTAAPKKTRQRRA
jgi:hypothetical protein